MNLSDSYHKTKLWIAMHPFYALVIAAALAALFWYFGGALGNAISGHATSQAVQKTEAAAEKQQDLGEAAKGAADQTSVDRKVEDGIRERTIQPEVERTRAAASQTRERLRQAELDYEKAIKDRSSSTLDDRALHQRNCTELADLYPGEHFDGCDK